MKDPLVSRVVFDLVSLKNRRCRFTEPILQLFIVYVLFYFVENEKLCQKCQNNQRFVKDECFVIRRIIKLFYRDVPDKMAVSSKSSSQYYCMTVIF